MHKLKRLFSLIITVVWRYADFAMIWFNPSSRILITLPAIREQFTLSSNQIDQLPRCEVNKSDPLIAYFDQENGLVRYDAPKDDGKYHETRQRNQVSVVLHNGCICLMKTYRDLSCLMNEVRALHRLRAIDALPKLVGINLKHRQVYQSLVPGIPLSETLNDNGESPVMLYYYENEMTDKADYPREFDAMTAYKWVTPAFVSQLSQLLNDIHDAKVLIRDVKFGNILQHQGMPYLVDFDAATVLTGQSSKNQALIAEENSRFNRLLPLDLDTHQSN